VWADRGISPATGGAIGFGLAADPSGNVFVAGAVLGNFQLGSLPVSTGGINAFIARLSAGGVLATTRAAAGSVALHAFPNPATGSTTLNLPAGGGQLVLTDALGRTVREQTLPTAAGPCSVSLDGLAPGIYQLRATLNTGSVAHAQVQVR
jgi:hypothetical protein